MFNAECRLAIRRTVHEEPPDDDDSDGGPVETGEEIAVNVRLPECEGPGVVVAAALRRLGGSPYLELARAVRVLGDPVNARPAVRDYARDLYAAAVAFLDACGSVPADELPG